MYTIYLFFLGLLELLAWSDSGELMDKLEVSDFSETVQLEGVYRLDKEINQWLALGWRIIRTWTVGEYLHALLGWPEHLGEPRRVEKPEVNLRSWEKMGE